MEGGRKRPSSKIYRFFLCFSLDKAQIFGIIDRAVAAAFYMQWYRSGHNEHDWKSCDGQKPSEGSNPSHCAKKKSTAKRCFSFWVPVQTDISIRMEGKSLDKHSS